MAKTISNGFTDLTKKDKRLIIAILIILIGIIGYVVGQWIPISYLRPQITSVPLQTYQYYALIINIMAAIVTFLAVMVALFKEDIRKIWECSKIEIRTPIDNIIEKLDTSSQSDSSDTHLEARAYESRIEINNTGNISAIGAEIYLEKLSFKGEFANSQIIETTGTALPWSGTEKTNIIIPPEGKKLLRIVELYGPEKQSLPTGDKTEYPPPTLKIGDVANKVEYNKGTWIGTFVLYSQNAKPVSFDVEIEWNGKWEKRLSEMRKHLKIIIKSK